MFRKEFTRLCQRSSSIDVPAQMRPGSASTLTRRRTSRRLVDGAWAALPAFSGGTRLALDRTMPGASGALHSGIVPRQPTVAACGCHDRVRGNATTETVLTGNVPHPARSRRRYRRQMPGVACGDRRELARNHVPDIQASCLRDVKDDLHPMGHSRTIVSRHASV